ncbi:uncharacterized protein LOC119983847 isoform X6 [Tripterygium wilfordii]|uniref:uncharacterized protein LOC119983847 isoform X6 n=1 Tax=Tripterygium wilfordii TaxID=458696 RepID=UPI0018F80E4C|nr:uncharacterized protein LOC119983847 isoform X6 [Tripterygium wilfordii]XP_038683507.1 uncharacterized protein LOC119983847 isoform X6 [Tripterygium wilfordii]
MVGANKNKPRKKIENDKAFQAVAELQTFVASVIDYMGTCELDLTQAYLGSPSILPRSMELYLRFRPLSRIQSGKGRKLSSFSFNQVRRIGFSHIIELSFPLTF